MKFDTVDTDPLIWSPAFTPVDCTKTGMVTSSPGASVPTVQSASITGPDVSPLWTNTHDAWLAFAIEPRIFGDPDSRNETTTQLSVSAPGLFTVAVHCDCVPGVREVRSTDDDTVNCDGSGEDPKNEQVSGAMARIVCESSEVKTLPERSTATPYG